MSTTLSRPIHLSLPFLIWALVVLIGPPGIHAQTSPGPIGGCTANGACDPGPRNPGDTNANCPNTAPPDEKFPGSTCTDFAQPPVPPNAVQPPAAGAGNVVAAAPNTVNNLIPLWFEAIPIFEEVASVQGTAINNVTGQTEQIIGLGPAFNSNSCFSCHEAPAVGGTSGGSVSIQISANTQFTFPMPLGFVENPELQAMRDDGNNTNSNPMFPTQFNSGGNSAFTTLLPQGPSLEVRLISSGNGGGSGGFVVQPGSVAELFTIQGRTDAPNCALAQFPFSSLGNRSISFRIPTPTFGLGFVEATPDLTLEGNLAATNTSTIVGGQSVATIASNLGVGGTFNRSGNDGTITRFGWKAQNKSLLIFAGEASNVEMGVTNNLFPNEKTVAANGPGTTGCPTNVAQSAGGFGDQPEDELLSINVPPPPSGANLVNQLASIISTNAENNRIFMLMNGAPSQCDETTAGSYGSPTPVCKSFTSSHVLNGQAIFNNLNPSSTTPFVGCALCHTPTQTSGLSQQAALSNQVYHPFSDFALHTMGNNTTGLADGVVQGLAGSQQFRTAPLWGLGQRLFFLHDGRASDLADAILDHCPTATAATTSTASSTNESCGSVSLFLGLSQQNQQDLLDYLRSL